MPGELQKIANDLLKKLEQVETIKYELDFAVRQKDHEVRLPSHKPRRNSCTFARLQINELSIAVNDLRGK